jgi:hypothetical protein
MMLLSNSLSMREKAYCETESALLENPKPLRKPPLPSLRYEFVTKAHSLGEILAESSDEKREQAASIVKKADSKESAHSRCSSFFSLGECFSQSSLRSEQESNQSMRKLSARPKRINSRSSISSMFHTSVSGDIDSENEYYSSETELFLRPNQHRKSSYQQGTSSSRGSGKSVRLARHRVSVSDTTYEGMPELGQTTQANRKSSIALSATQTTNSFLSASEDVEEWQSVLSSGEYGSAASGLASPTFSRGRLSPDSEKRFMWFNAEDRGVELDEALPYMLRCFVIAASQHYHFDPCAFVMFLRRPILYFHILGANPHQSKKERAFYMVSRYVAPFTARLFNYAYKRYTDGFSPVNSFDKTLFARLKLDAMLGMTKMEQIKGCEFDKDIAKALLCFSSMVYEDFHGYTNDTVDPSCSGIKTVKSILDDWSVPSLRCRGVKLKSFPEQKAACYVFWDRLHQVVIVAFKGKSITCTRPERSPT